MGERDSLKMLLDRLKWVPTNRLLRKYRSVVESTGNKLGKNVELHLASSEETEIPLKYFKNLDPLISHILRNAIDHGIEGSDERIEAEKEAVASVTINSQSSAAGFIFNIIDDGRGIDVGKIRAVALKKGFRAKEQLEAMTPGQILALLFTPGFSSAEAVTDISGRGVGLDVVRTEMEKLGGKLKLTTRKGRGTTFQLTYPIAPRVDPGAGAAG